MRRCLFLQATLVLAATTLSVSPARAQRYVYLTETPNYEWHAGCFGTASGNLMGYWDRHGFPDFYTGPTAGGIAPLDSFGGNTGIRALWASEAGVDGRPASEMGHMDDYYVGYESTAQDPYTVTNANQPEPRKEHAPDCIGDFIGLNQRKWTNALMNGECSGNIDAYSFVFWDATGNRRVNYTPTNASGAWLPDIQSGFKAWTRYRGYDADVFTQLNDHRVNQAGRGFTYDNLKAEIDAGYPVLFFLQPPNEIYRSFNTTNKYNPEIHGVMAYGYVENVPEVGFSKGVLLRTSWASPNEVIVEWGTSWLGLWPARGAIGFHPLPKITRITRNGSGLTLTWDGPSSELFDVIAGSSTQTHRYQLERATSLNPANFTVVGAPTTERTITAPDCCGEATAFYRVVLLAPGS